MTTTIWHLSNLAQLKKGRIVLAIGAKVQFFAGGTTTPLTTYVDSGASTPHNTASLVTDGNGLWPAIYVPYGDFDYRVLDSDNTIIATATNVPNPAPVDPTVTDPNALMQTGDMIFSPAAVTRAGFVRSNGNTIGSGASSGTERANDDAEALFTWTHNNLADAQAAVSGGRGSSAAADWSANKVIVLPDLRGSNPLGLDDMGAGAASRLVTAPFTNGDATTGGSVVGGNTVTLVEANLPAHVHAAGNIVADAAGAHFHAAGSIVADSNGSHTHGVSDPTHTHQVNDYRTNVTVDNDNLGSTVTGVLFGGATLFAAVASPTGITLQTGGAHTHTTSGNTSTSDNHTHVTSGNSASVGSGTATNIVQRSVLGTWLLKL